jgi:hypothetical protein
MVCVWPAWLPLPPDVCAADVRWARTHARTRAQVNTSRRDDRLAIIGGHAGGLRKEYLAEKRDAEVAHMAMSHAEEQRIRARQALDARLDRLRRIQEEKYEAAVRRMGVHHGAELRQRLEDEARPSLDLAAMQEELEHQVVAAQAEADRLQLSRRARAKASRRARAARGAFLHLRQSVATALDLEGDTRLVSAEAEAAEAEAALRQARAQCVAAAADAPMGDAMVHLSAMRAKLAMLDTFGGKPPTKSAIRTYAAYIEAEIQDMKTEMAETAPHIADYKAAMSELGQALGALDAFTAELVGGPFPSWNRSISTDI